MPHPLDDAAVVLPALAEPSDVLHEESAAEFAEQSKDISH